MSSLRLMRGVAFVEGVLAEIKNAKQYKNTGSGPCLLAIFIFNSEKKDIFLN